MVAGAEGAEGAVGAHSEMRY
ncbi:unnamed protein product, partial [Rotaria sp. Silwood1]